MSGCGRDESAPTPDGLFRGCLRSVRHVFCGCFVYFSRCVRCILADRQQCFGKPSAAVGDRFIVPTYTYSPCIGNLFETHSRNVRNVLVICVLHIRRVKVWFLRHKSMVFGVQKPPFYIAKTTFLKFQNRVLNLEHIRQYKNTESFLLSHRWAVDM